MSQMIFNIIQEVICNNLSYEHRYNKIVKLKILRLESSKNDEIILIKKSRTRETPENEFLDGLTLNECETLDSSIKFREPHQNT